MPLEEKNISEKIEHLFRYEYGKLVSVLTKTFGTSNIELAEDVVQEAMLEALNKWTYNGIPNNAVGWIYKVAKYKAINLLNREKHKQQYTSDNAHLLQSEWTAEPILNQIFTDKEIADDQLRMIFTCCNPCISQDSQVALTLKTLCGFSIPEIAKAFLTSKENVNKRLVRARKAIKEANIPFEVPQGKELEQRLSSVLEAIYLLFNEGYQANSLDHPIRYELCEESIRLAEIIASNPIIKSSNTYALLALMTLNTSRFKSRMDELNNILDLEHQDRSQWDKELIKKGLYYLEFAAQQNEVSIYHILATISAHHCAAIDFKSTDWESILTLYDMLVEIDPSPVVQLNRAIVFSKTTSPKKALQQLEQIKDNSIFKSYFPYYTTMATLHFQNNETVKGQKFLDEALKQFKTKNHKHLIDSVLNQFLKNI